MRRRIIDPEFWLDEELAKSSTRARLLFIGLWNICDDNYATFPNKPDWIKVQIFPYERVDINKGLEELEQIGFIIKFTSAEDQKEYFFIKNFFKYQRIDKPSAPKYKKYPNTRRLLAESSPTTRAQVKLSKEKIREVKLSKSSAEDSGGGLPPFLKEKIKTLGVKN